MATIDLAVAASHTPGLTGWFDKAGESAQETVRRAYDVIHDSVVQADLDVLIVVGNDHVGNSRVDEVPDFTFALAERHRGPDEWFKPWLKIDDYDVPGEPSVASALAEAVTQASTQVTLRSETDSLRFDDNLSVPVTMARLTETDVPIIPVLHNCTVPPVADERACYDFGRSLGQAIEDQLPNNLSVGLFGSGGLSHEPGGPGYLEIDEEFDRWWLNLLVEGDHERILSDVTFDRMEKAGSGGTSELLSWMVVMGAIGPEPCTNLGYVAVDEWRCGVGAVKWEV